MRTTGPGQSALLLLDVVDVLSAEGVQYLVIGAMAASVHGLIRASLDADAVLSAAPSELRVLEKKFKLAGFDTELRQGDEDDPIAALLEVGDAYGNRVDLLTGLRGFRFATFSRAVDVPFHGKMLQVAGLEDFIAMKLFAGGPQDLEDARRVLQVAGENLDLALLQQLVEGYGPSAVKALRNVEIPRS